MPRDAPKVKTFLSNRRNTELLLLIAATPIVLLLFIMDLVNQGTALSFSTLIVPIGLVIAFGISHIAVRIFAPNADAVILPIVFLLAGIGITFVMRLSPDLAVRQVMWLFLAIAFMVAVLVVVKRLDVFSHYKYIIGLAGLILLLLPALVGTSQYGSKIWLSFGGFSIQPGEFAKILIVLFLASYLSENRELLTVGQGRFNLPSLSTLLPMLVMWGIAIIIMVAENDLGSALLFFGLFTIMLYGATGRKFYVFVAIALIGIAAVGAYFTFSHVQVRFQIWLNPFEYAQTSGYQLVQAIYSMADGGLVGCGIGRGFPTLIPVVASDFIFAAIAEEMGLLGAAGVLIAFLVFTVRGYVTSARATNDFTALAALGLTSAIALQAFVIVGGITRVIPLTGLTLPFMSQGGTSLLASFIIVGLLLRAGDEGVRPGSELELAHSFSGDKLGRSALGHRLTVLMVGFALLFSILIAALTYIQVIRADYYQSLSSNNHTIARDAQKQRGSILTSDNVILAESVENSDGTYSRVYPEGSLAAHVLGYTSTQYGSTGVEASMESQLVGTSGYTTWSDAINSLAGTPTAGNDVTLTINSKIQTVAEQQLEGYTGAIVVMNPETGAVLAEASSPTYDVSQVDSILSGSSSSGALYNRATQALYAPGSSFKVVTLASALTNGTVTADTSFSAPASIDIGGAAVTNFNSESWSTLTVREATWYSANTVYGQIADKLGASALVSTAKAFGFEDSSIAQDFSLTTSLMPDASEMTEWETAWAGDGQPVGQHTSPSGPQATVMQMALVASAVANDGVLVHPYLVQSVSSPAGELISTTQTEVYGTVMSSTVASEIRDILTGVVTNGTGTLAAVDGTTVAGKTGTAETSSTSYDAWFIGMAPADDPKVVVAVIIEDAGSDASTAAAPLAGACIQEALQEEGLL